MTPKLESATKYDLFDGNAEQRPIITSHVKKVAESMRKYGFLPSKPIQVRRDGKRFRIIDGHHRFAAAKSLGIAFYYVIEPEDHQETMAPVNLLVKTWGVIDFVRMYASRGMAEYQEILRHSEMGIPVTMVASLLHGESAASGNATESVRAGTFKIKTRENLNKLVEFIKEFESRNPVVKHRPFIDSFSRCLLTKEFDLDQFRQRFESNPTMIEKASNVDLQLQQMEDLYNFRSRERVPLAFLVKEASAKRKLTFSR